LSLQALFVHISGFLNIAEKDKIIVAEKRCKISRVNATVHHLG